MDSTCKNNSLASSSNNKTIKIWNQINDTSFKCVAKLIQHNGQIMSLTVDQNALPISGDENGQIFIWNQTSFDLLQKIQGHSKEVSSLIVLNNENLATLL